MLMVPHDIHKQCALQCLHTGKHVLLEKPVAHDLEGALRLESTAGETDRVFAVAENAPFWPEVVKSKDLIASGTLGEVYFAKANYWESSASMGEIMEVIGITAHPFKLSKGETLGHALLRFSSGKAGVVHCHYMDIPMTDLPFFQIFGSEGEIAIHGKFSGGLTVLTKSSPKGENVETLGGYEEAFPPQMEEFLSAIVADRPLRDSVSEGMGEVLFAKAVYKSLQTKQWESTQPDNLFNY